MLSVFTYDASWDFQELHPGGDELAFVLAGDVVGLLDEGDGETPVHLDEGSACLIPAGAWHRLEPHVRSTVLFITPEPSRTEHRFLDARPET